MTGRKHGETRKHPLIQKNFRITQEQNNRLVRIVEATDLTFSQLLRRALDSYLPSIEYRHGIGGDTDDTATETEVLTET